MEEFKPKNEEEARNYAKLQEIRRKRDSAKYDNKNKNQRLVMSKNNTRADPFDKLHSLV